MAIATVDPSTGKTIRTFQPHTDAQVEEKLARAEAAVRLQRETAPSERARRVARAAEILKTRREELGRLMTQEMGKLRRAALGEVDKCALGCTYYAENGPRFIADEEVKTDAVKSLVRYQPLGVVLAVMPWNFPLWQVFRFAAPALVAGNVGLLKHASNVPQTALAVEEIFREAGFPEGVFQTLLVESNRVGKLLDDPRIAAATLTGSEGAGRSIGESAGRNLKKVVLELGGSDPFVVLPSADLERAVKVAVEARIQNAGQSCIAAKRFIVHARIYDEFAQRMARRISELRVGDPQDDSTDVGPLSSKQVLDDLEDQVKRMIAKGAKVLAGGKRVERPGFFFQPTLLTDAGPGSPGRDEEVFGPVATIFKVRDVSEAIELANATRFGLGAAAWTRDGAEVRRLTDAIQAGQVFINGMVKSDPRLPFGGVKASGHGRELSAIGLREFVNTKTVWIGEGAGERLAGVE
ncbi:MAG TPA: NAD-dependent succinate-semialdehyde dehydrogenase [Myxococcales bacterium]|nr:NAD-dependent succinate-semialdehyde dehydrogenase [Myxococcales bacterium]